MKYGVDLSSLKIGQRSVPTSFHHLCNQMPQDSMISISLVSFYCMDRFDYGFQSWPASGDIVGIYDNVNVS